jgi:hypothetical protein
MTEEHTTDTGQDAGGKAHTELDEPHPAGDGARSGRETGGPTSETQEPDDQPHGGAHGDRPSGFDAHE